METIKGLFWKPDPAEQHRKCQSLIRSNARSLDRHIYQLKTLESKTKQLILQTSRRKNATPGEIRMLARELVRVRKQHARLNTSKAQLESVGMQVSEAFSIRKIEGTLKASTKVMKDVNTLVRVPELMGTMRELGYELMKAGVIDEMVGDMVPEVPEEEDEEAEEEVDKVLGELIGGRLETSPSVPVESMPEVAKPVEEEEESELKQMQNRLQALKS